VSTYEQGILDAMSVVRRVWQENAPPLDKRVELAEKIVAECLEGIHDLPRDVSPMRYMNDEVFSAASSLSVAAQKFADLTNGLPWRDPDK
jgi:hypothetical protein